MIKTIKFYTLKELQTKSFDDTEFSLLLDNNYLIYSIINEMFKYVNININKKDIPLICSTKKWMYKYTWTWKQHDDFIIELSKVIKNLYFYNIEKSIKISQDLVYQYGFTVLDENKQNIKNHYKKICKYTWEQ